MFHPVLSSQGHPFPIHVDLRDAGLRTTSLTSFKLTYFILYMCLPVHVCVCACSCGCVCIFVCMHVYMFSHVCGSLRTASETIPCIPPTFIFRDRVSQACMPATKYARLAASLASVHPSIPASPVLGLQAHTTPSFFHVASGVQPQVLILTSQTLAVRAITPACHLSLYISVFNTAPF